MTAFAPIATFNQQLLPRTRRRAEPRHRQGDRCLIALAGLAVQVALGGVQAWSVLRAPLTETHGWSIAQVTLAYTMLVCMLGPAALAGGLWLNRAGPRIVTLAAALLFGLGTAGAGLAGDRLWLFYLSFGVVGGVGRGLGYIVPVAVLPRWFPDRPGLANGVAMGGIGVGALVAAPLTAPLVAVAGVTATLVILGLLQLLLLGAAALVLRYPGEINLLSVSTARATGPAARDCSLGEALRTPRFFGLWLLMFLSTVGGHGLIAEAAPMAREMTGTTVAGAAGLVVALSLANTAGRFLLAWLSDHCGRAAVLVALFAVQAVAFALLPVAGSLPAFAALTAVVMLAYGGSCSVSGAMTADVFGQRHTSAIYGLLLTSAGAGAIVGPQLLAGLRQATGAYTGAVLILALIISLGAVLPLLVRVPGKVGMAA